MAEGSGGDSGVLRELLAVFGFGVDDKELKKGESRLDGFLEKVKHVAEGVAAAFMVDQIYEFAEGQAAAMNAIERTSSMLGMSTERVQQYQFAAKSLGLDINAVTDSISRMQVAQQMAADGGKEQAQAFQRVGASVKDANGHFKDANALFLDVADGISKMADPAQQAAAAQYIFGRSGRQLLPFLKEGRKGVEEYFEVYKELGGGYDKDAIAKGKEFDKQSAKTNLTLTALKNTIAKALLPIVTAISHGVQVAAKWMNQMAKDSHILEAALIVLGSVGAAFAVEMAIANAPLLLLAAAIAAVVLAVDDLYTFLTGGQSEIGDLLDKLFGKGTQEEALAKIKERWVDIKGVLADIVPYLRDVVHYFGWILDRWKDIGEVLGKIAAKATLQNPNDILGDRSKTPLTADQREDVIARMHMRQQEMLATGASLPTGYYGPLNAPPSSGRNASLPTGYYSAQNTPPGGGGNVNVVVNPPPGLNEKQVGEHVGKAVNEVLKQNRRAAAATLPRAGT